MDKLLISLAISYIFTFTLTQILNNNFNFNNYNSIFLFNLFNIIFSKLITTYISSFIYKELYKKKIYEPCKLQIIYELINLLLFSICNNLFKNIYNSKFKIDIFKNSILISVIYLFYQIVIEPLINSVNYGKNDEKIQKNLNNALNQIFSFYMIDYMDDFIFNNSYIQIIVNFVSGYFRDFIYKQLKN